MKDLPQRSNELDRGSAAKEMLVEAVAARVLDSDNG